MKRSAPLQKGHCIGVMAPSGYVEENDIKKSQALLENLGYPVFIHPQTFERHNQSAGTHNQKLDALHELWGRDDIHAIWAAGGGNRALHILDALDFDLIRKNPKPFIGFSDVTALLNGIYAHTGLPTFHGPVFRSLHKYRPLDKMLDLLGNNEISYRFDQATLLRKGQATGPLIGGNLSLFQYLPETLPNDFYTGALLFLEDCNEELSRIDRMLLHLKRLGVLSKVSGLIIGEFTNLQDSARPFGFTLDDLIKEHTAELDIPILINAPFGHGENLVPLPIGMHATLDSESKSLKIHS